MEILMLCFGRSKGFMSKITSQTSVTTQIYFVSKFIDFPDVANWDLDQLID